MDAKVYHSFLVDCNLLPQPRRSLSRSLIASRNTKDSSNSATNGQSLEALISSLYNQQMFWRKRSIIPPSQLYDGSLQYCLQAGPRKPGWTGKEKDA